MSLLGIFGGTFDPIHYGHLRTVREVMQALALDEMRFIPAYRPPHRQQPIASAQQRREMLALALEQEPGFVLDDREYRRDKPSYTVDTLTDLQKELPATSLCLVIGADSLLTLESWHQWQQLFDLCHIIVMARPGYDISSIIADNELPWLAPRLCTDKTMLQQRQHGCIFIQPVTEQAVSATGIRKAIIAGESIGHMLPASVADYIKNEHLYESD